MNNKNNRLNGYCFDPNVFFKGASPCKLHEDVMQEIRKERSVHFVDSLQVRDDQDWSFLAEKVVGSEILQDA